MRGESGPGAQHDVIPNLDMIGYPALTTHDYVLSCFNRPGQGAQSGDGAVLSDIIVVGYLNHVVDLGPSPDDGRAESGPVDAGVASYLDIIFNDYFSHLGNLDLISGLIQNISESISAQYRPGVNDAAIADLDILIHRDIGVDSGLRAYLGIQANEGPRADDRSSADSHSCLDHRPGLDRDLAPYFSFRADSGVR